MPAGIAERLDRLPLAMADALRTLQPADVVRGLAVRALLHRAWAADSDPAAFLANWQTDENGRPSIPGFPAFNASHAGRLTAVAMRPAPSIRPSAEGQHTPGPALGLDLEHIRPIGFDLLRPYMSDTEWDDIEHHDDPRARFFHFWTAKEALMKAEGLGFRLPIEEIALRGDAAMIRGRQWHLTRPIWPDNVPPGYAWHLATPEAEPDTRIQCCDWDRLWTV